MAKGLIIINHSNAQVEILFNKGVNVLDSAIKPNKSITNYWYVCENYGYNLEV